MSTDQDIKSIAIVGGGIAGLYCAYELARRLCAFEIIVLEATSDFGGRVETVDMNGFKAEFGPMRFEPKLQHKLKNLADDLGITFAPFTPMGDEASISADACERYDFSHDEIQTRRLSGDRPPKPLDLLRLGALRMFRKSLCGYLEEEPEAFDLNADTVAKPPPGEWTETTKRGEWKWAIDTGQTWDYDPALQRTQTRIQEWLDHFDADHGENSYRELRQTATHRGIPLWNEAFWNAIGRELSPAAARYVRNEGSFYHLFPDNPNAVEWGIFWLRLFRSEAEDLRGIEGGSAELIEKITSDLLTRPNVRLRSGQEVVSVDNAADCAAVSLRVRDHRNGEDYVMEADHCILALPLAPLKTLSASFPEDIRAGLHYALGFPLLKCFLQVRNPWWRKEIPTHTGASGATTRELHYQRGDDQPTRGLVMLYTDQPASQFWKQYVTKPIHDNAEVGTAEGPLKNALVYHLLILARRQAHFDLKELLLDALADPSGNPPSGTTDDIKVFMEHLGKMTLPRLRNWYRDLVGGPPATSELKQLERVLDVLRNPSCFKDTEKCTNTRAAVSKALIGPKLAQNPARWEEFVEIATSPEEPQGVAPINTHKSDVTGRVDDEIERWGKLVEMWGIRDWGRWPVGAACHTWIAGARSWEIMDRQVSFGLIGRRDSRKHRNVHICGEALSDYTGFIEGSLRTAASVIDALCPERNVTPQERAKRPAPAGGDGSHPGVIPGSPGEPEGC